MFSLMKNIIETGNCCELKTFRLRFDNFFPVLRETMTMEVSCELMRKVLINFSCNQRIEMQMLAAVTHDVLLQGCEMLLFFRIRARCFQLFAVAAAVNNVK